MRMGTATASGALVSRGSARRACWSSLVASAVRPTLLAATPLRSNSSAGATLKSLSGFLLFGSGRDWGRDTLPIATHPPADGEPRPLVRRSEIHSVPVGTELSW